MRSIASRVAEWSNVVGAIVLVAFGARYAVSSIGAMLERDAAGPSGIASSRPAGSAPAVASGTPVRVKLVVYAKSERAEVRVDGAKLGSSPYLGETSCRAGETVVVELVPARGSIKRYERPCAPGAIRIDER
jgi:hypothetical protein